MTERRQYEEHLAFTLRELSHRTKNMLAVVQGLTHMIARRSDNIEDFETRLRGCIQALAYSHDLLVQHDWQGATLEELLRVQLALVRRARQRPVSWRRDRRSSCSRRRCSRSG